MNPQDNIMAQARQAVQGARPTAQPQGMPQAPTMPQKAGLPVPPPQVAMNLAKMAVTMNPMVLGTLIWRALKQHGESLNQKGIQDLGQGGQPPMPQGVPMTGGPNVQAR
jgi:hypothetical protein